MPMTAVPSPARKAISKDGKPEIKTPATTAHAPMTRSGAGNADACTPVVFNIRAGTPVSVNVVENSKIKVGRAIPIADNTADVNPFRQLQRPIPLERLRSHESELGLNSLAAHTQSFSLR
ncbi:unnamed protein product [Nippostrongylus brasiliensis]|uniref:EKA-like protein n=1 Tax=Nippostrongylus brasiliensis TaxID=27835 RepID=A0A0N4XYB3_NIPBR|nr:unnamed protein product [Nippostrongylus brasiliensis]